MFEFNPNWVSAPGDTIADILFERGWRDKDVATLLGLRLVEFDLLLKGEMRIDSTLAGLLAQTLGATPEFWINRERHYREGLEIGLPKI